MAVSLGYSLVSKAGTRGSFGQQRAAVGGDIAASAVTQRPVETVDDPNGSEDSGDRGDQRGTDLTHRHFGHPQEHPVALRHRKKSADPLHGEEDSLVDEWKDIREKATRGECSPQEMSRMRQVKGRIDEIQSTREGDARRIVGDELNNGMDDSAAWLGKAMDAATMVAESVLRNASGHKHYLHPGEKPPAGVQAQHGERGGTYYEAPGGGRGQQGDPGGHNQARAWRENAVRHEAPEGGRPGMADSQTGQLPPREYRDSEHGPVPQMSEDEVARVTERNRQQQQQQDPNGDQKTLANPADHGLHPGEGRALDRFIQEQGGRDRLVAWMEDNHVSLDGIGDEMAQDFMDANGLDDSMFEERTDLRDRMASYFQSVLAPGKEPSMGQDTGQPGLDPQRGAGNDAVAAEPDQQAEQDQSASFEWDLTHTLDLLDSPEASKYLRGVTSDAEREWALQSDDGSLSNRDGRWSDELAEDATRALKRGGFIDGADLSAVREATSDWAKVQFDRWQSGGNGGPDPDQQRDERQDRDMMHRSADGPVRVPGTLFVAKQDRIRFEQRAI